MYTADVQGFLKFVQASPSAFHAVAAAVKLLEEKGYCFVTVSELAALRGTELEPGNVYTDFAEK